MASLKEVYYEIKGEVEDERAGKVHVNEIDEEDDYREQNIKTQLGSIL